MTRMRDTTNHDRLLHVIDHPQPDADAPRNPVLTHQVMERVRLSHATAHATSHASARITKSETRPWILGAAVVAVIALAATSTGVVSDGGLGEAAGLFDGEQMLELVIGAVIAAAVLALSWRRLA
jgi:hypothetical protein